MNNTLKEALKSQKFKNDLRQAVGQQESISKNRLSESNLYTTFVQPFVDVFDALKITTKDILSNTMLVFGQVLTLNPEKQKERREKYKARQQKIQAEWKPLMDKADKFLGSGDADIVALAYSPGLYIASAAGATAYNAAEGVGKFLDDLDLKKGILSVLPGVSDSSVSTSSSSSSEKSDSKSLLDKLNTLFLGTAIASGIASKVIKSKAKTKKENKESNASLLREASDTFVKDMNQYLKDTGLEAEFNNMQESLFEYYSDMIKELDSLFESRKKFVSNVLTSEDIEGLVEAFEKVDDEDLKRESEKIRKSYEEAREKLMKSEDFVNTLKDQSNRQELTDEQIMKGADKVLFSDFMKEINESLEDDLEAVKKQIGEELQEGLPSDETLDIVKRTKVGMKLFNMIRDAKNKYNIS